MKTMLHLFALYPLDENVICDLWFVYSVLDVSRIIILSLY